MAALNVRDLGNFIRDQRRAAKISLRELAKQAGVSNPYLSQIERGLRKPSAEILQQIAKALRISAEALYVQAGILEEREGNVDLLSAVLTDAELTERQKQVILDIYKAFRRENAEEAADTAPKAASNASPVPDPAATAAATAAATEVTTGVTEPQVLPNGTTSSTKPPAPRAASPRTAHGTAESAAAQAL